MSRAKARSVSRRAAIARPAVLFIVVTEGEVTEYEYLKAFGRVFGHRAVRLDLIRGVGDPRAVVERAIAEKTVLVEEAVTVNDSVWAVFDRDAHERFAEAGDMAKANRIAVAKSNPCFELWGIFHYRDYDAPIERHDCQKVLEQLCETYDRRRNKNFASKELIQGSYGEAVDRAESSLVRRAAEGAPGSSPSTSVHCLTEHFRRVVSKVGKGGRVLGR